MRGAVLDPPPLPPRLTDIRTVVGAGTALWTLGAVGLLLFHALTERPLDGWFATCLAGAALGGIGYAIFSWQRAAARRGSRTAQDGLT